LILLRMGLEKL